MKVVKEQSPTNSMGGSSTSQGPIQTFDPLLRKGKKKKVLKRFKNFLRVSK